jgi:phosphoribosylformylglycinamidine synthase
MQKALSAHTLTSGSQWRIYEVCSDVGSQVAIIREEGSNGDREMAAAMYAAGLEPWDVTMSDLLTGKANLEAFRGCVFVGGFSYADVLDSAKGWAGGIRFNPSVKKQFEDFYNRSDTFSLGVCNGCQLSALLGCEEPVEPVVATVLLR